MVTEQELIKMVADLQAQRYSTEEEEAEAIEALEQALPGCFYVLRTDEYYGRPPEEVIARARQDFRVFAVGPTGAEITHPERENKDKAT